MGSSIFFNPAQRANALAWRANAPARRADAPARRADALAWRANAPARRANAPARRADAPAQRADAPARRADAPAQRANPPAWDGKSPIDGDTREITMTRANAPRNFLAKKFSTPSGCLTGVVRVSLEMITKFLSAIQAATRCFRRHTQFPSRFARQSEFSF
ncbi:MAG: hypothetical protein EBY32_11230 [Proteobacteria bacterium]|nr:hypothetical protein [Pseudomonadota bacterium]